jgi:lactoylglutathione lyase
MSANAIWHFSFHVGDLDRSVDFYTRLLGMDLIHRQEQANAYTASLVGYPEAHLRVAQLAVPGRPHDSVSTHDLELVEYVHPHFDALPIERARPGSAHLAFAITDINEEFERLSSQGVQFVSPPNLIESGVNKGGGTCYFLDPDGITLELVQPPKRSSDPTT